MFGKLKKRYLKSPRPVTEFWTDAAVTIVLMAAFPVPLWHSIMAALEQRFCQRGRHWNRVMRVSRALQPVEWRCRLCDQWKWFSDGKERHDMPPWYKH
jgi:hypothetical protein